MSSSNVKPLAGPQYEELTSITRSLHLGQAMSSYGKQRLTSHKIVSRTVNLNAKVLWFAPSRPMNENNMYGNVSFTLDWKTALEQLGPFLYHVDQQKKNEFIFSRVLLTNKKNAFLTTVDEEGYSMPMKKFESKHYAATACEYGKHVLEIGVEVNGLGEEWVYMNCKILANDHSSANILLYPGGPYNFCSCHRFNYFGNECPSPYNLQRTKKILQKRCPTMLRDRPAGASHTSHPIPGTKSKTKRRRKVTTKVEVVERTPARTSSSATNVRTLGFNSSEKISNHATSYRTNGTPQSSSVGVGRSSSTISNNAVSLRTYESPPSSSVRQSSSAKSNNAASLRTYDSQPSSSVGQSSCAISNNEASLRTYDSLPPSRVGQSSSATSNNAASLRTYDSPPSSSVGQSSSAISNNAAIPSPTLYRAYGNTSERKVGHFIRSSHEDSPKRSCCCC